MILREIGPSAHGFIGHRRPRNRALLIPLIGAFVLTSALFPGVSEARPRDVRMARLAAKKVKPVDLRIIGNQLHAKGTWAWVLCYKGASVVRPFAADSASPALFVPPSYCQSDEAGFVNTNRGIILAHSGRLNISRGKDLAAAADKAAELIQEARANGWRVQRNGKLIRNYPPIFLCYPQNLRLKLQELLAAGVSGPYWPKTRDGRKVFYDELLKLIPAIQYANFGEQVDFHTNALTDVWAVGKESPSEYGD